MVDKNKPCPVCGEKWLTIVYAAGKIVKIYCPTCKTEWSTQETSS